jgi:omega-amidase
VQDLNITMLQMDLQWQNPTANKNLAEQLLAETDAATDLIILPEMFNTGFTLDAATNAETMDGPTVEWLRNLAARQQAAVCGSLIINDAGKHFNRMVWVLKDGTMGHYDKRHLFRMGGEDEGFSAGQERRVFMVGEWRVFPQICYDLRFPAWSRGLNEFDLMIYVANWPATRQSSWDILLPARAVENQCYVAGVNRIGVDGNDIIYTGGSMALDFLGRTIKASGIAETAVTATLKGKQAQVYREKFPAWKDGDKFTFEL